MASEITRWNPFREMAEMQNRLDRMFDESWRNLRPNWTEGNLSLDVHETDDNYTVVANLPGLNADDIDVQLQDGTLTISAEINETHKEENARILMQERFIGKIRRSIVLPQHVDMEKVDASYSNGVLTLTLPKTAEAQPRRIAIKSNNVISSN